MHNVCILTSQDCWGAMNDWRSTWRSSSQSFSHGMVLPKGDSKGMTADYAVSDMPVSGPHLRNLASAARDWSPRCPKLTVHGVWFLLRTHLICRICVCMCMCVFAGSCGWESGLETLIEQERDHSTWLLHVHHGDVWPELGFLSHIVNPWRPSHACYFVLTASYVGMLWI